METRIELPIKLPSLANLTWHWTKKYKLKKNHKNLINLYLSQHRKELENRSHYNIKIIRVSPRKLDDDNLIAACKHIVDSVTDFLRPGLPPGRSDGLDCFTISYGQETGKQQLIIVTIS